MKVTLPECQIIRVNSGTSKAGNPYMVATLVSGRDIFELFVPESYRNDFDGHEGDICTAPVVNLTFSHGGWRVYPAWRD